MLQAANIQHSDEKNNAGAHLVECFVTVDKLTHRGLDFEGYTWVTGWKITDDDVYQEYVATGKVRGFSIEAYGDMIPVKFSNSNKVQSTSIEEVFTILKKSGYL